MVMSRLEFLNTSVESYDVDEVLRILDEVMDSGEDNDDPEMGMITTKWETRLIDDGFLHYVEDEDGQSYVERTDKMQNLSAGETKNDRFRRIANSRLSKAVERIRMLHTLGSSAYDYDADEVEFIVKALHDEAEKVRIALLGVASSDVPQFGAKK